MGHKPRENRIPDNGDSGNGKGTVLGTTDRRNPSENIPANLHSLTNKTYMVSVICVLLLLAVALVFGRTVGYEFVSYDDGPYVYENPQVAGGLTARGVAWAFT
jgi:hypothetical protein